MSTNPYAAPRATVADETLATNADFIPGGQRQPAGHGWSWVASGWALYKPHPWLWIGIWLLLWIIFFGVGLIPFLGGIATVLFWPVLLAGLAVGCRTIDQGGTLELAHLFAGFREHTGTLVGVGAICLAFTFAVGLLVSVAGISGFAMLGAGPEQWMAAGLTVVLGVLVFMALLLPLMMAVWFAPMLVYFHDLGAIESMKQSFAGCWRNIMPFLVHGLVLLGLAVLASLPIFLGWLVLWPVISAAAYAAYKDIYLRPRP